MYNQSHKFNRGASSRGGGATGASKRKPFHHPPPPPPPRRHSNPIPRTRTRTPPPPPPPPPTDHHPADETYRLVSGEVNPLSLAAIIRLVPDLVHDIKRLEAQGGRARIKFDSNPKNPGNVIDVDGKEYHFTWADEKNCDIYEERQGGEDGNGLLVETGYAWRKLTAKRELDESAKKQVKKSSVEWEEKHKNRTTKPMDPGNPSKSHMKARAAAEASPWKQKQKDFQSKNKSFEPSQAGGSINPIQRHKKSLTTSEKGRYSSSPLPSPQNQYISLASPSARGNAAESRTTYDPSTIEGRSKENGGSPHKIVSPQVTARTHGGFVSEKLLITLLKDNSKGMTLKALEKAVGDSARRIEPLLKKIATYEPPGRYMLKPGVELGNMNSSPVDKHQKQFVARNSYGGVPMPDMGFAENSPADDMEEQLPDLHLNNKCEGELNVIENFDPSHHLTDLFGDNEPPGHNEGHGVSSSNSDSDSESSSSGSGTKSASQSRSRSRSPAGSASDSSSDSEADSSLNNKETSDVEVDIMNDDDDEPKKFRETLVPWSMPEAKADGNDGHLDGYVSEDVDIENGFLDDNEENVKQVPHDRDQQQNHDAADVVNERERDEDKSKHEHFDSIVNPQKKSKRSSNVVHMEQNTDNVKRLKGRSLAQSSGHTEPPSHAPQSPQQTRPDKHNLDHHDNHRSPMSNQLIRNDNANGNMVDEREHNNHVPGKSTVGSLQSGRRPPVRYHTTDNADRATNNPLTSGLIARPQRDTVKQVYTDLSAVQHEDGSNENSKESPLYQKSSTRPEPSNKHHDARSKKSHDNSARRQSTLSLKDATKADFDSPIKARRLRRELSDLEVGEFREPLVEEPDISKRPFERVSSFKKSEAKLGTGSRNTDLKTNLANRPTVHPRSASSPISSGLPRKTHSLSKCGSPEPYEGIQSQQQQSSSARAQVDSLSSQAVDLNRLGFGEAFADQGTDEGYGETQRKSFDNARQEDSQQKLGSRKGKGNKPRKSKAIGDGEDKKRDVSVGRTDKHKRNESSDENASYFKYEKIEPEIKGPIKSFSQYKEYVQEYREKYDSYCSLNKILENYRNEFQKLGLDLESAKGRDMERYYGILAQLRESYRQCGTRHKRFKKIFIVLHEELKDLKQRIKDFAADYMKD